MKTRHLLTLLLCALCTAVNLSAQTSFGQLRLLDSGWRFQLADNAKASEPTFDDSRWRPVAVPHDWGVTQPMSPDCGSCQSYLPGGIGWYRCHFTPNATDVAAGRRLFVFFEGVYNRSTVYLNGHELGYRPSGFASFLYDLTPYLKAGEDNVLAVRVDHSRQNDARWYTGSGINRPVWLVAAPDVHLALWGTAWRVKSLGQKKAEVEVDVETANDGAPDHATRKAQVEIIDADGRVVASKQTTIGAAEKRTLTLSIGNPKRWDIDTPYLYKVVTRLLTGGQETDRSEVTMGLRTLTFSSDKGFALNGRWMKVKGVCVHDDAGVLGTAVPADVWRTRLLTLKSLGTNAIRMSHNPHAPAVYDLCDELGLLVMDEASDEWEFPKRKWLKGWNQGTPGYEGTFDYFEEWIDRDVADMVRRDRCHASIFLWSIGNEVDYPNDPYSHPVLDGGNAAINQPMFGGYKPDAPNAERIGRIAKRIAKVIRSIDTSRPVTGALAGVVMSNQTEYPEAIDVVGYNYTENRYDTDHQQYPKRIIYGSETGVGYDAWKAVRDREHIFGQFVWTGTDYLGESGRWPSRGLNTGLLDFASFRKPRGWFRAALWSDEPTTYAGAYPIPGNRDNGQRAGQGRRNNRRANFVSPEAQDDWNWKEGQTVRVVCYTNAPQARLLLNGEVVGPLKAQNDTTGIIHWDIPYQAGTLRAEGCNADGTVQSAYVMQTHGEASALRVSELLPEDDDEVMQLLVEVVDAEGRRVKASLADIACTLSGPAQLLGLEGCNNTDMSDYRDNHQPAYRGRLVAYVQRTAPGPIAVQFTAEGLRSCTFNAK